MARDPLLALALLGIALAAGAGCVRSPSAGPAPALVEALAELGAAGFEFEADVRFRRDPMSICDGLACAELVLERQRRTIRLAPEAFESPSRLRASLLEIWERYRQPHRVSLADHARGLLRVLRDGPRVGVRDPELLRRARHLYAQAHAQLTERERADLPAPRSGYRQH